MQLMSEEPQCEREHDAHGEEVVRIRRDPGIGERLGGGERDVPGRAGEERHRCFQRPPSQCGVGRRLTAAEEVFASPAHADRVPGCPTLQRVGEQALGVHARFESPQVAPAVSHREQDAKRGRTARVALGADELRRGQRRDGFARSERRLAASRVRAVAATVGVDPRDRGQRGEAIDQRVAVGAQRLGRTGGGPRPQVREISERDDVLAQAPIHGDPRLSRCQLGDASHLVSPLVQQVAPFRHAKRGDDHRHENGDPEHRHRRPNELQRLTPPVRSRFGSRLAGITNTTAPWRSRRSRNP